MVPGEVRNVQWLDKIEFAWDPLVCIDVYNVYREVAVRLIDVDSNGVADSYGPCFLPDRLVPQGADPSSPLPGRCNYYLVTGENGSGEGTLGSASNGLARPNTLPCP